MNLRQYSVPSLWLVSILFGGLILANCTGKTDDVVPGSATASLNSITATVDGIQRAFKTVQAPPSKILIKTSKLAVLFTEQYTRQNAIQMSATVAPYTGRDTEYLMIINMIPTTGSIGTFDITPAQGHTIGNSYFSYTVSVNGNATSYYPSTGTLEITKYENKTIEGKFSGTLLAQSTTSTSIDTSKKAIVIKDGFFKAEIEDAR